MACSMFNDDQMRAAARQALKDWYFGQRRYNKALMARAAAARSLKPKKVKHAIRK